jgi:hypothetical protein
MVRSALMNEFPGIDAISVSRLNTIVKHKLQLSMMKPVVIAREGLNPVNLLKRKAYAMEHYNGVDVDAVGDIAREAANMLQWSLKAHRWTYLFMDESGFNLNLTHRKYCRGRKGSRVVTAQRYLDLNQ